MADFVQYIFNWYIKNKRDLPWRQTNNPYYIWISEIILQQTRVEQGTAYYLRFIEKFPTVEKLAAANEDEVLKIWQGLGYYSRARNMHSAARQIIESYNGKFPENYDEIRSLKGIGAYTAAAVSSIAFNLPYPAVDGNVYRVLSRYFGITVPVDTGKGKNEFYHVATELISDKNPGFHNQAFMEFGALQCIPKSPNCKMCPVVQTCFAFQNKMVNQLPVKSKKAKQKDRFFYYFFIEVGNSTFLEKRTGNDIWQNLYQFPLFESEKELRDEEALQNENFPILNSCSYTIKNITGTKKHVLSHQIIYARLIHVQLNDCTCLNGNFIQVNKKDISTFAVPRLVELFLHELKLN